MDLFNTEIAGNSIARILVFFAIILSSFVIGKLLKVLLCKNSHRLLAKQKENAALIFECLASTTTFVAFTVGIVFGLQILHLGNAESFFDPASKILIVIAVVYAIWILVEVPATIMMRYAKNTESKLDDILIPLVTRSLRTAVVILGLIQTAQILSGKELSAIVASLGIGGLAVALAAQDTIKNFFGSILILVDKPFELGDRINVDGYDGPVEEVGLRSTRIRNLDGHLVTIPNGDLSNKAIQNISKRPYIRRVFDITVTYDTPPAKVQEAKAILEDILKDHEGQEGDLVPRVYFKDFNSASLGFLCIYWYHPPAYWDYLAFTEKVNLAILERFNAAGIDFAFPTQTLYLAGDPKRPIEMASSPSKEQ